jgi:uncharacterized protein YbcI
MNYKLMARILLKKDNSRFGAVIVQKLSYPETEELIFNLDDMSFLNDIRTELIKDTDNSKAQQIVNLIDARLNELMLGRRENSLPN